VGSVIAAVPGERASRRDAGRVSATQRDAEALRWVAEQYTVQDDTLAVLLARLAGVDPRRQATDRVGLPTVRHATRRWVRAGWAERRRALEHVWTVPTAAGYRLAGIEPKASPELPADVLVMEPWALRLRLLAHVHAVAVTRLWAEARMTPGQRWVSERELRREARQETRGTILRHIFDGAVEGADGTRIGIDVELSLKSPAMFREAVERPVSPRFARALYVAPERLVSTLLTRLGGLDPTVPTGVQVLPDLGIAYLEG
jgi:hypothetical protein